MVEISDHISKVVENLIFKIVNVFRPPLKIWSKFSTYIQIWSKISNTFRSFRNVVEKVKKNYKIFILHRKIKFSTIIPTLSSRSCSAAPYSISRSLGSNQAIHRFSFHERQFVLLEMLEECATTPFGFWPPWRHGIIIKFLNNNTL